MKKRRKIFDQLLREAAALKKDNRQVSGFCNRLIVHDTGPQMLARREAKSTVQVSIPEDRKPESRAPQIGVAEIRSLKIGSN